ncbi:MAG: diaminopimelate epimerase [Muribaculaceae bacterium]
MKKLIRFTKMHGAGNDYIYLDGMENCPDDLNALSIAMSDRHKGVGSDGLVVIMPSEVADFRMRMFNADGSEGEMCGNASRCIGKYVYEKGLTKKRHITLETLAGIKSLSLNVSDDNTVDSVTVDMGEPILEPTRIPVSLDRELIKTPISTEAGIFEITAVSMGNPHGVVFVKSLDDVDVHKVGRELEVNPIFPQKANIEFAQILKRDEIRMRVWERGSGETLACGTGACATLVAGVLTGSCDRKVTIHLLGGDLNIEWVEQNDHVYMTGPAEMVFEGTYIYKRDND